MKASTSANGPNEIDCDNGDEESTALKNTTSSSSVNNIKKRKRKITKFDASMISMEAKEAQRLERERLDRIERNKKELNAASYAPVSTVQIQAQNLETDSEINYSYDDVEEDDDLFIEEVIPAKPIRKIDLIELGSSEDEDDGGMQASTSLGTREYDASLQLDRIEHLRQAEKFRLRRRRRSADYDKTETGDDGRLLVNAGRPESDPDVFVAPHLTNILQPHQIGGVKFMYDNIIESLESFHNSTGFGCILAHSMGLGKSIQAITFIEIFIRVTKQRRVLLLCPVNVLQNWKNEFHKWMPETDQETGLPIRHFDLFVLGDSVKTIEYRSEIIEKWHQNGGVLLMGYEMFRLLVQQAELSGYKTNVPKKNSKKQQRTVFDLAADLSKYSEEEQAQLIQREELRKRVRQALLSPGPDLVVCDEGHRIKNLNSEIAGALSAINTKRRIVLTGYPLQNNLMEYYCMVEFVRPSYLGSKKDFQFMFDKPIRNGMCIDSTRSDIKLSRLRIHVLCDLLRGFVQRRSQHLLKKILPECREFVLLLRKSEIQHSLYRAFHNYVSGEIQTGEGSFNPLKAFAICMKIINHPDLLYQAVLKTRKTDKINAIHQNDSVCEPSSSALHCQPTTSTMDTYSNQPIPLKDNSANFFTQPVPPLFQTNSNNQSGFVEIEKQHWQQPYQERQFFCPPPPIQQRYSQHISQSYSQQHQPYNFFQTPPYPSGNTSQIPHFYHQQPQYQGFSSQSSLHQSFPPFQQQQQQPYRHQFFTMDYSHQNVSKFSFKQNAGMLNDLEENPIACGQEISPSQPKIEYATNDGHQQQNLDNIDLPSDFGTCEKDEKSNDSAIKPKQTKTKKKTRNKEDDLLSDEFLFEDSSINLEWAEPLLSDYSLSILTNSTKMFIAMAIISESIKRGEKLLLFSQSVVTLNKIEVFLKKQNGKIVGPQGELIEFRKNITYCRFDGSTSGSDREKIINRFNQNPSIWLFLISTRAGSLGVNLVSANRVIIFDCSWNPVHDSQAICRIYRYGQRRRTYIYRLVMANSMERQVFNRQISKQGLQRRVVDEQLIDANIMKKEVENLLIYNESDDVLSTQHHLDNEGVNELDDELLSGLVGTFPNKFFELPFLHESMLLEHEEGLSAEEKIEAQLLYEREKRGFNFAPQLNGQLSSSSSSSQHTNHTFPRPQFTPSFGDTGQPWHSTPFPKNIELVSAINNFRKQQQQHGGVAPPVMIRERLTLPKIVPSGQQPFHTLMPGDYVSMFFSSKGCYFRTTEGHILDATNTPCGKIIMQQFKAVPMPAVRRSTDPSEIIQIDD